MQGMVGTLHGITVFIDNNLVVVAQVRFPKTRKKRILKKWAKRMINYNSVPNPNYYTFGNKIVCHPITFEKLRKSLKV